MQNKNHLTDFGKNKVLANFLNRYPFEVGDWIIYTGKDKKLKKHFGKQLLQFKGNFHNDTMSKNSGVSLLSATNVEYRIKESELRNFRKAGRK